MNKRQKNLKLCSNGTSNPRPGKIKDELFSSNSFFDPNDLMQVKYEMLRSVEKDGKNVSEAAKAFGFSRPSFYAIKAKFKAKGLSGLISNRRGPKHPHKLTPEIVIFIERTIEEGRDSPNWKELSKSIYSEFGSVIHPRTIERTTKKQKKSTKKLRGKVL